MLLDGKDLSRWVQIGKGSDKGKTVAPRWKVQNGYVEIVPGSGEIQSKEKFGDAQYHIEWAAPKGSTAPASGAATAAFC